MCAKPIYDHGKVADWGKTSEDYATYRPGYPESFYDKLKEQAIGLPDQHILDLGTGTGVLARTFASQGCHVTGADISDGQITQAQKLAHQQNLNIDFRVSDAEKTGLPDSSFDAITASMCWLYFDPEKIYGEVKRMLKDDGKVAVCWIAWLPRQDEVARKSEELILQHNPKWTASDWDGELKENPHWANNGFKLDTVVQYDVDMPFTHEAWRGRMRACRGVGASLPVDDVKRFDDDHAKLLEDTVPQNFTVLHRVIAIIHMLDS